MGSLAVTTAKVDGLPVVELSDIAWDNDHQRLYAISDDGYLYTMTITIRDNTLKQAKILSAVRLKGPDKKPLRGGDNDPEGLTLTQHQNGKSGDTQLIISFEGNSRIARYSTSGDYISDVSIPSKLRGKQNYRSHNSALESVTNHPKHGFITAAELPLKTHASNTQTLYASNGQEWHFPRARAKESSITALEVLSNGDILVLERAFSGLFSPLIITLRQVKLNHCDQKRHCEVKEIARFSSAEGWAVDNFEGLAKLQGDRYLMISDDNKNPLQQSILVMFEVLP